MKIMRVASVPIALDTLLAGQLKFLNSRWEVVGVASPDEKVHERIRAREGVRTIPVNIERRISPAKDVRSLAQLYRVFRRERPQIVHSLTPKAGLLSMAAAWMAGVPVRVHTFTGLIFPWRSGVMRRVLIAADRLTCVFATHVIPEGEGVKKDLLKSRVTRKPMPVLDGSNINGVDTKHFSPPAHRGTHNGVTRFVFVGRVVRDKGVEELREAFEQMRSEGRNVEMVFVGLLEQALDPLRDDTLRWLESGEGVTHVGFQEDIRPWLRSADVFVLPSHREGFPGSPLQAGAMGLPAILTDICGCNEIVVDGETGFLIPPRDADALHAAMCLLADNPDRRAEMGAAARRRMVEKFQQKKVWRALNGFYADVLAQKELSEAI